MPGTLTDEPDTLKVVPFNREDQQWFARCTGDYNQIHLDAATAQRSMFGSPIVHGIHSLIACLDQVANDPKIADFIKTLLKPTLGFEIAVRFVNPVFLNETTRIEISRFDERSLKAGVFVDELKVTDFTIAAAIKNDSDQLVDQIDAKMKFPLRENQEPKEFDAANARNMGGVLDCSGLNSASISERYADVSKLFGEEFIHCLAPLSALVGMYAPGRYSIFSTLKLASISQNSNRSQNNDIRFAVDKYDGRFGLLKASVSCSRFSGSIEAFQRPPPVDPPNYTDIAKHFSSNRFSGNTALVIGGSRGLGAFLTKALVAEGCNVLSSFARSKQEMDSMIEEAQSSNLSAVKLDILDMEQDILEVLEQSVPDYIFYMATPHIFARRTKKWDQNLFEKFNKFYVGGLAQVASAADALGRNVKIYNPSSVVIDEPIDALLEYRISKIASEQMALNLNKNSKTVEIVNDRLPRLMTDQNTQVMSAQGSDMLSVVEGIFDRINGA